MREVIGRGVVGSTLLTLGGFSYARIPNAGWAIHTRLLMAVRHSPDHLALGLSAATIGLALLTWAWWDLRHAARDDADGVRIVRIAAACWSVPMLIAPPLFSGDGWSYVATGYLTGRGLSPYHYTPSILPEPLRSGVNPRWLHTPSPYGPLALGWGGAATQITDHPWLLLLAYRVFSLIALALLAWAVPRLAERSGRHPGAASWLAIASPFVLAHGIGGLHNDLMVAALCAVGLAVTRRDQWIWGAVFVGAAAAVKIPGGLVAAGVVMLSLAPAATYAARIRRTVEVGLVAAGTVLGLGVVVGVGTGWFGALSVPSSIGSRLSLSHDLGMMVSSVTGLPGGPTDSWVQGIAVAAMALSAAWLILRHDCRDYASILVAVGGLMLGVTLFSPAVHYWYLLWCLPLLACVAISPRQRGAVVGLVVALGITATADPSLQVNLLYVVTLVLLVVAPIAGYLGVRWRDRDQDRSPQPATIAA